MKKANKIAMAVAVFCCAGATLAQEINPSWYIQPNVVGVKPDRDFGTDKRHAGGGLKFGKAISPMWDLQFGASHVRDEDGAFNYHQTLVGADALWMLSRKNFRPFVLVGVGAQRDKVDNPLRHNSATSPYAKAGVGFQLGFNDQWAMQADLSTVRGRLDQDEFGFSRSNNKYLTVGLNYAFSKPAPPPPPPAPPPQVIEQPAPAPVAPPPPPPPPPARFEKVTMSSTELFEFNSSRLRMPQPKLDDIAAALTADPSITDVDITGHADRIGSSAYNMKLSTARANSVRDYLVSKGIDGKRLKAYGKGETMPVVTCNNKKRADLIKCLEPNRRVEVEQITVERRVQ
ncbi:OmpA family protein [Massilia sp. R2A-15]|uniref:OmpA family protein n=1 Tax=Massilia sp. R2A-15 TaxID=3064278 RepID=UPI0027361480|nr:OmpA family protein [Massilia sp. R2A-15]WLI90456.1 OmpA family protein [Massilia sp. R2A-15]